MCETKSAYGKITKTFKILVQKLGSKGYLTQRYQCNVRMYITERKGKQE